MQPPGDIGGYVRVVWARKWEIALIALLILGSVIFFTVRMTPMYAAQSTVLVKGIPNPGSSGVVLQPDVLTEQALILQSSDIEANVQKSLKLTIMSGQLQKDLRVTVLPDTDLIHIQYSDRSPLMAANIANAFADAYVAFHRTQATSQLQAAAVAVQAQIVGLQTKINQLQARVRAAKDPATRTQLQSQSGVLYSQLGVLNQRLLDLTSTAGIAQTSALVVRPAPIPTQPASPSFGKNIAAGLAGGLVLAVAVALVRERLDDRLGAPDELERILDAPILAIVPRVREWRKPNEAMLVIRADPRSPASEAYRTLATNLQYLASRQPLNVVMVASAVRGEGKTATSCNLGVALAQAGKRVILVSADLRMPRVHMFFDLKNEVGISHLEFEPMSRSELLVDPGTPNLLVVHSGPTPIDPVALLGSRSVRDFIASLRDSADFVIVDVPPVLGLADASVLAPLVDGTIVVVNEETSGASNLGRARDQLDTAGARIVGSVYNNFDLRKHMAYSYNAGSRYTAYEPVEPAATTENGGRTLSWRGRDRSPQPAMKRPDEQP